MKSEGSLYPLHNSLPLVPILSHIEPVHALPSIWWKIHYIIILPSIPGSSKWSLSTSFGTTILHTCHMSSLPHSSSFVHSNHTWWAVQIIQLLIMQFPPVPITSFSLGSTMNAYTIKFLLRLPSQQQKNTVSNCQFLQPFWIWPEFLQWLHNLPFPS